ncbi:MAG: UDP-N-acetylglucosamine 2-epimerase [Candidatus Paceibacterota bacterium]|jgi:GDP/UDP-N,N'-diacetylbacillosamine 2-epimerase (hydrolysing)
MIKKNKKRKIAIIAGSRGEYGYYRPIIREIIKRKNLDYGIIASNMHVLDSFGSSIKEIKKDNFKVSASVFNTFDGYNHLTMVKSLGVFMLQLPEILKQMEADIILLAGDRGEQLVGAVTGAYTYTPVAHIQAGEVSGNIDGTTRHGITKFSHIHFAANKDAADRVIKMGEEKFRVHNVGAPMLDELVSGFTTPKKEVYKKFNLDEKKPILLFVYHSVTEELADLSHHMDEIMSALRSLPYQVVVILNNSDAGCNVIRQKLAEHKTPLMNIFPNVTRQDYAGLMTVADAVVGNSSSGILEAPTFKLPAVNIGNRQKGRMQSINVVNVGYEAGAIKRAIAKAISPEFKKVVSVCKNPYGDGRSAKRIVDILESIVIDDKLLIKRISY